MVPSGAAVDLAAGWFLFFLLPKTLAYPKKSGLRDATVSIGPLLKKSVKREKPPKTSPNWRINYKNFVKKSSRHMCEPGAVNFSAGWLGQGHTVGFQFYSATLTKLLAN
jgi:hypothetical protein